MARRTRLEVLGSILGICRGEGSSKTRIVYQVNLNFKNAGAYLKWLTEKGYLERADRLYKLTPAGEEMLKELNEINSILQIEAPQAKKEISD